MTESDDQREPDLPWYKWYPRDWVTDDVVQELDWQGQGIYRHLLDRQWIEGSIPADPDRIAAGVKMDPIFFRKIWDVIRHKFEPAWEQPDRLINPKLNEQRETAIVEVLAKIEGGRRGGYSKAKKRRRRKVTRPPDKLTSGSAVADLKDKGRLTSTDTDTDTDTLPPTQDSAPARAEPKKRGPDSWLTPFDDEWARTHGGTHFLKRGAKTGGEMGKWLKIVKREILEQDRLIMEKDQLNEMFKRWRSFLKEAAQFATLAKFAKEHGLHKKGKFVGGHDVHRARPREPAGRDKPKLTPSI